jgi:hypothetical protein
MTAQPPDQSARRRAGVPPPQLGQLEITIGRLRFGVIAIAVAMIAGFAVLGTEFWRLNDRVDQLAAKVSGNDVTLGVKFDETNATLAAISQRLSAEFRTVGAELKTLEAQIATQTSNLAKSIATVRSVPLPPPTSLQPEPTPARPAPGSAAKPVTTTLPKAQQ